MKPILPKPLRGIIPPMVTPLLDNDTLDVVGLENLIEHILAGGVHGLFILGTTGEAPSLSYKLRQQLIERATDQVGDRVPVLVGITDTSYDESVKLADIAYKHGVSGLVLAPPSYFPVAQPELLEYLEHLAARLPLPLFLYNIPGLTKVKFEPKTILQAAQIEGIVGLKDSSSDMTYFNTVKAKMKNYPDFTLLVGPEELLAEAVLIGAHGGISGGANMFPRLYVELYNAAMARDMQKVKSLHEMVMKISTRIYNVGQYGSRIIKGIKCVLNQLNICNDFMAEPFHKFHKPQKLKIEKYLASIQHELQPLEGQLYQIPMSTLEGKTTYYRQSH